MQFLHDSRPSGQIHTVPLRGIRAQGSAGSARLAGLRREYIRPRGTDGQYVRDERTRRGALRQVCTQILPVPQAIGAVKGIRHAYIGSGIRYDLFLDESGYVDESSCPYFRELVLEHTSGRLKVAPEHTEDKVLKLMAKPSFRLFMRLRDEFDRIVSERGRHCGLVPYFISGHPGCTIHDMERLSRNPALKGLYMDQNPALKGLYMDQVQDFTPTPMTASSVMFYSGYDPSTMQKVFVERDIERKRRQKSFFFKKK